MNGVVHSSLNNFLGCNNAVYHVSHGLLKGIQCTVFASKQTGQIGLNNVVALVDELKS